MILKLLCHFYKNNNEAIERLQIFPWSEEFELKYRFKKYFKKSQSCQVSTLPSNKE